MVALWSSLLATGLAATFGSGQEQRQQQALRMEEQENYYKKWLSEDVVYIIAPEEKAVFEGLANEAERERFVEQFWVRRDLDSRNVYNEFKEEHYRRIAYANDRFASGIPGWMTDRGRIYITHGPPDEIESHPAGGPYDRPAYEGGGGTATYPFEIWRYRYIEGIGSDVELEFVDSSQSSEYRLALNSWEKDALLFIPNAGLTRAEEMGVANKWDRPFFNPGNRQPGKFPFMVQRTKDLPFQRYETYKNIKRPQAVKFRDLRELININVTYANLPVDVRQDYFKLNNRQALAPITVLLSNKHLTFKKEGDVHVAKVSVYGIVTTITRRMVMDFDEELTASYQPHQLEQGLQAQSMYQKIIALDNNMRYRLDLVVKDRNSGQVGVVRRALVPPSYDGEKLSLSAMILSNSVRLLKKVPQEDRMFVLGDVWIRPSLKNTFSKGKPLRAYLQVYNAGLDQSTLNPAVTIHYRVLRDGNPVSGWIDETGETAQFFSDQRIVLIGVLPIRKIDAGTYEAEVEVRDLITGQVKTARESFQVLATGS